MSVLNCSWRYFPSRSWIRWLHSKHIHEKSRRHMVILLPTNSPHTCAAFATTVNAKTIKQFSSDSVSETFAYSNQSNRCLLHMNPEEFQQFLKENDISRCFLIFDDKEKKVVPSHPQLDELAQFFAKDKIDYNEHEAVFMQLGARTGCLLGAFIWRTQRGQSCGGIRLWKYSKMEQYLRDGLRLAIGMGTKSALAGLWAGGGKGVIPAPSDNAHCDPKFRQKLFFDYGDFLTSLNGCYVAAEDVGLNVLDLNNVHTRTRYTTCISEDLGGSGNPSIATAKGVICAMEAALDFCNMGDLKGKHVVIQGTGNVGIVIIQELLNKGAGFIQAVDCHQKQIDDAKHMFFDKSLSKQRLEFVKVPLDDLSALSYPCDILSPCALGNVLTAMTIPKIKAKIVCGAANNQLGTPKDNQRMQDEGITYVVDFLANRMGIVNCANETYGRLPGDPAIQDHFDSDLKDGIFQRTKTVLQRALDENITPGEAAFHLASELSQQPHPIWPGRTKKIIERLAQTGWHDGNDFWRKRSNFTRGQVDSHI